MATSQKYLNPLRAFRKRVAYANAFNTDLPVPLETAAFLNKQSSVPHRFISNHGVTFDCGTETNSAINKRNFLKKQDARTCPQIVATVQTDSFPNWGDKNIERNANSALAEKNDVDDDLLVMSSSLDSLGWKKVFVDMRFEIPIGVTFPQLRKTNNSIIGYKISLSASPPSTKEGSNRSVNKDTDGDDNSIVRNRSENLVDELRNRNVVESKDLARALRPPRDRISLPIGHNMLVAFSRDRFSTQIYRGGRPVMDLLAEELTNEILRWSRPSDI
eukprot:CAMPEP_0194400604 /NCGR_PEP_ID=MMETSP0174-20130528/127325_1 /TAXON_ID=216777 /ORGANISM="Proboscia alata, Strain PI-D3" /LENGTH=273 /DNA_ID=CAMNT_0039197177 /DNA_START=1337 /DNA_END=2158 /DNA_ORIENTATION=-